MKGKILFTGLSLVLGLNWIYGFSKDKKKEKFSSKYVQIPSGTTEIDGKQVQVSSFWISDREISNKEYNEFLSDLESKGKTKELGICRIKNEKWQTEFDMNFSPLNMHYNNNEAYAQYPVLNISHEAAIIFCNWLTENNNNYEYRLPTRKEWVYAAKGGVEKSFYSWGNNSLRNKDGLLMCNFRYIGDEFITVDSDNKLAIVEVISESNSADITAPVHSYWTNNYGLYNMCGNVAEMIEKEGVALGGSWNNTGFDVRITSELKYSDANPMVGFRPVRVNKE